MGRRIGRAGRTMNAAPSPSPLRCLQIFRTPRLFMKQIFGHLLLVSLLSCGDRTQTIKNSTIDSVAKADIETVKQILPTPSNQYGFDTTYDIAIEHKPYLVTGYLNADDILDTAILVRHKSTGKDALFIKHGKKNKIFLLQEGKDLGTDFPDFNWVGQFEIIKKGTKVWDNVITGEIVGEEKVPDNKKIILPTDGIFVHVDEASGGGVIYFNKGKYKWIQQD